MSDVMDRGAAEQPRREEPTIAQLESLRPFSTAAEAIEAHRDREVEPILPKVIGTREDHRVVLPGDPDYPA